MSLRETLTGAVVMAPMTKGSNLPYRRLCVELGARVLVSEMVVARRLKQQRRSEFALIRRAPGEPTFAVQLAGNKPEEMAWAARWLRREARTSSTSTLDALSITSREWDWGPRWAVSPLAWRASLAPCARR